jgi:hypothetical protein
MRNLHDKMSFTGGAEATPTVEVVRFHCPGSLHGGDRSLIISQEGESVMISPETMQSILDWYNEK